jgi:hypothetical protein
MSCPSLPSSSSDLEGTQAVAAATSFLLGNPTPDCISTMSRPDDSTLADAVLLLQYVKQTHRLPNFAAAIRQLGIEAGYKKASPVQVQGLVVGNNFTRTDAIAAHQKVIRAQHSLIVQLKHQVSILQYVSFASRRNTRPQRALISSTAILTP